MKAIILKEFGNTDNLIEKELPLPVAKNDEVLIQVKAISINPVDIKTRKGKSLGPSLKDEDPLILGWDVSGVVVETGSSVSGFKIGDEVFGMINFPGHGKAYAEYVAAPASHLALKPENVSHEEAAAATLAALTAWQILVTHVNIKAADGVLITAAAGGVGHYAVQIAKYLGAYIIGVSSAANKDFVMQLGADEHIDYATQKIEQAVDNIDLVIDAMGDNVDPLLAVTKKGGTVVTLPSGGKDMTENAKSKGVHWHHYSVVSNGKDQQAIAELLANGKIRSFVSQKFHLSNIVEAHHQIESGKTKGKIVTVI